MALGGRDLHGGRGNVMNGEFRVVHVRSDLQHADFLAKPLHRKAFCVHRNFVMNISGLVSTSGLFLFLILLLGLIFVSRFKYIVESRR